MTIKLDSKTQSEINTVCNLGVEKYISNKHKENIKLNFERGLVGSLLGCLSLFAVSKINSNIKLGYLIFPASLGIISSSAVSIMDYNNNDESYRNDFEEVCKTNSSEK
jgi:hypothetical protein